MCVWLFCFVLRTVSHFIDQASFELLISLPQLAKSSTRLKDTYHHTQLTFLKHGPPGKNHNSKVSERIYMDAVQTPNP